MEKGTILVVDDEQIILHTIGANLEHEGYRVEKADNGEAAIALLSENPIDLVITDLVMEGIDGFGVLEEAKHLNPDTMVIILTGYGDMDSAVNALRLGADDYLVKPSNIPEIIFRIEKCLEKQALKLAITRHRAELVSSEREWRASFDAISDTIFLIDVEHKIFQCNKASSKFLGITTDEILGRTCHELVHGSAGPIEGCPLVRAMKTHKREFMVLRVDDRWLMVTVDPFLDAADNFTGAVHVIRDITDMKRLEMDLKERTHSLRNRVNEIKCLYRISNLAADPDLSLNDICEGVVNLIPSSLQSPEKICSRIQIRGREFITKNFKETSRKRTKGVSVNGEEVGSLEVYYMEKDSGPGEEPFSEEEKMLIDDIADRLGRIAARIREKEKKVRLRDRLQQAKKLESLGTLAGGIAHDFNNLLAVILGNIDLARMYGDPGSESDQALSEAAKASIKAKDLSAQFLTFSSGGSPAKETGSVEKVIRDCVTLSLSGSKVKGEISMPDSLWLVKFGREQIKQVVSNMMINAREAMEDGGIVRITGRNVSLKEGDAPKLKEGKYVRISIEDNGTGIPEKNLEKVFDPYFSTKGMGIQKGRGLGLSICHSIIKKHGGFIELASREGVGTTIVFYLPAVEDQVTKKKPVEKTAAGKPPVAGKGKILVMDDELQVRRLTGQILVRVGYKVEYAKDGEEAIAIYEKGMKEGKPFDGVVLDLTVKGAMGGEEAVKKLIEMDPEARVIISSGYSNDPILAHFREYGFRAAITKPFTIDELQRAIEALVVGKELSCASD